MTVRVAHLSLISRAVEGRTSPLLLRTLAVLLAVTVTAAAAQVSVPLPFTAVPFTLQPMIVLLAGAALGSRLGATAQVAYLVAGIAGLPVFAASAVLPPGAGRLLGPTGGYLLAYPLAAFVTGWLAERGWDRRYLTSGLAMLAGLGIIYTGGVSWLTALHVPSVQAALAAGVIPFFFLDVLKITAAALVLPRAWKLLSP